jgi:hypothetical protein
MCVVLQQENTYTQAEFAINAEKFHPFAVEVSLISGSHVQT